MRARARDTAARGVAGVVARPLHAGVLTLVVGLLCGPRAPRLAVGLAAVLLLVAALLTVAPRWFTAPGRGERGDRTGGGRPRSRRREATVAGAAAVAVLLGAVVGDGRADALGRSGLGPELGRSVTAHVVLREAPRTSRFGGWSALVEHRGEPVLLRVTRPSLGPRPPVGAVLAVALGDLRPPGAFAALRHAHAELRVPEVAVAGRRGGVAGRLDAVRVRAEAALDRGLPPVAAGLLRGMVLGQDDALPDDARASFRAAGLSHLVAASGTNVVLLAALATAFGAAVGLGLSARLCLVLALIVVYVPLAGGGASIQRAGIMGAAAVAAGLVGRPARVPARRGAAGLVGRPASRWYALGAAAALTLVLDPRAAEAPGWQLSFAAVVSLIVLAPGWRRALARRGVPGPLAEVTAMTAAATLATAPIIAAHFGEASLVAVPANVLAAPAVAPVMWLGVVAAALGQLVPLGGPPADLVGVALDGLDALAGFPLGYLAWIATTAASAPGAVVAVGPWLVAGVVAGVLAVASSWRVRRSVPVLALVAAALWAGLAPPPRAPAGVPDGFRLTFLDVGQGDATLLQDGGTSVLVDAGLPDAGIVELLRGAGVRRLDLFVATHASADHEGGAAAVVSGLPVAAVLDGRDGVSTPGGDAMAAAARRRGIRLIAAQAGQELRLGGLRLRVLWPRPRSSGHPAGEDPNERAVVLEAEARGARALLTADAESEVLSRLELRPVDVLKVAHHGSADPGLPSVLERLSPRVAGIEVGAGNTYGHPAPSTLAALSRVPVVVRTDRDGSVRLDRSANGRWEIRAHASSRSAGRAGRGSSGPGGAVGAPGSRQGRD